MNAIPMIARCMVRSEAGTPLVEMMPPDAPSDLEWLRDKQAEPALPEEPMGHGDQGIEPLTPEGQA